MIGYRLLIGCFIQWFLLSSFTYCLPLFWCTLFCTAHCYVSRHNLSRLDEYKNLLMEKLLIFYYQIQNDILHCFDEWKPPKYKVSCINVQ